MNVNQILLTKDGRIFGNSIIIKVNNKGKFNTYDIKTDYGNVVENLNRKFIVQQFYLANKFQMMRVEEHKHYVHGCDKCPECNNDLIELHSGVKCSKCDYNFCL